MKFSLVKKLSLYISGISASLLVIAIFIVSPAVNKIITIKTDINKIQEELEQRQQRTQQLKKSLQKLTTIKQEVNKFSQATIQPGEELKVITELENLANIYNIDQTLNLRFRDTTKDKKTKKTPSKTHPLPQYYQFSFLNNGLFADHIKYLKALEALPYYLVIDNLYFEKRQGSEDKETSPVTLRFDAIIYVDPT